MKTTLIDIEPVLMRTDRSVASSWNRIREAQAALLATINNLSRDHSQLAASFEALDRLSRLNLRLVAHPKPHGDDSAA